MRTKGPDDWRAALLRDPCVYCGDPAVSLDHIRPRAHGGVDHWENRAPACARCNGRNGADPLLYFLWLNQRPGRWNGLRLRTPATRRARRRAVASEQTVPRLVYSLGDILGAALSAPLMFHGEHTPPCGAT